MNAIELSRFASRVNTNYAPTGEEIIQIKELLAEPLSKLKDLDEEIEEMKSKLEEREQEHQKLQDEVEAYHAMISSPIRRLPEDLLREIFVQCLPVDHPAPMHPSYAPMLLTAICSGWRDIAFTTPRLWGTIHIPIPNSSPYYYIEDQAEIDEFQHLALEMVRKRAESVDEWLKRSGACPLDISLYSYGAVNVEHTKIIFEAINVFAARWRKVKLSCPVDCFRGLDRLTEFDVPMLESLTLLGDGGASFHPEPFFWRSSPLLKAPRLRELCVSQIFEDPTLFPMNWPQLTSLTLQSLNRTTDPPSTTRVFGILKQCKNLVICRVDLPMSPPVFPPDSETVDPSLMPISLHSLKSLAINDGGSDISGYLAILDIPSLQCLEFFGGSQWVEGPGTKLQKLLSRTSDTLRRFVTDSKLFENGDFIECLKLCPRLTSLSMRRAPLSSMPQPSHVPAKIDDNFLALLTAPDAEGKVLCPLLEEFELYENPSVSDTALNEFIKKKQTRATPGVSKLKRMAATFNRKETVPKDEEIVAFEAEGLKLEIMHMGAPYMRNQFSTLDGLPYSPIPRTFELEDF